MGTFITPRGPWAAPVFFLVVACAACTQESPGGADAAAPAGGDFAGKTLVDASVEEGADANPASAPDAATPADGAVGGDANGAVDITKITLPERLAGVCPEFPGDHPNCANMDEGFECQTAGDCQAAGGGAFCFAVSGIEPCLCGYTECLEDGDCEPGHSCNCLDYRTGALFGNTCTLGCRSSNECGPGEKCVQAGRFGCRGEFSAENWRLAGVAGFRCTNLAKDQCRGDEQCPEGTVCVFSKEQDHFVCQTPLQEFSCE